MKIDNQREKNSFQVSFVVIVEIHISWINYSKKKLFKYK